MTFDKYRGKVFDIKMTANEKKAFDELCMNSVLQIQDNYEEDYNYMLLYVLHKYLGFGKKRLKDIYLLLAKEQAELKRNYQARDGVFVATYELKKQGINIKEWEKEKI